MRKTIALASIVMLTWPLLAPAAANAQFFRWNPDWGFMRRPGYLRVFDGRRETLRREIIEARASVNHQLSEGEISPARAARLTARLDDLAARISEGPMTPERLEALRARIENVRIAAESGVYY